MTNSKKELNPKPVLFDLIKRNCIPNGSDKNFFWSLLDVSPYFSAIFVPGLKKMSVSTTCTWQVSDALPVAQNLEIETNLDIIF